jgi:hypothetical protein
MTMISRHASPATALVLALILLTGRRAPADETYPPVAGTVTLNGQPVGGGKITFYLSGDEFVGARLRDGRYKLTRLPAGRWRVGIEGEGIPAKFASEETTGLTVEVREGGSVFDFDLKRK